MPVPLCIGARFICVCVVVSSRRDGGGRFFLQRGRGYKKKRQMAARNSFLTAICRFNFSFELSLKLLLFNHSHHINGVAASTN